MKKRTKLITTCLTAAMVSTMALAGCASQNSQSASSSSGSNSSNGKQITIGFSVGVNMVKHWNLEVKGAEAAAKDNGAKLNWKSADLNQQTQVSDIENMVQSGVKALIVAPVDSQGIVPTINEVKSKNIPVITSDIGVSGTTVASHVSSDNVKIGEMAADELAKLMGDKGNIGIIDWTTVSATADREKGFLDELKKYPNMHVIDKQDCGGDRNQALSLTENMIQQYPNLDGIFGVNASAAMGAYGATTAANKKITIMAVDEDDDVLQAIKTGGNLKATISQDPYDMGYTAVKTALAVLKGQKVQPTITIPVVLTTKGNADQILARDNKN